MTIGVAVMPGAASSARAVFIGRNKPLTPSSLSSSSSLSLSSSSSSSSSASSLSMSMSRKVRCRITRSKSAICCEVAEAETDEELKVNMEKVGSKVRVKAPLKVYHVAKLPDLELTPDMVGVIKQYVGFWKGKRISPNYPFKVQFLVDHPTTGTPVKFVAHLKEDEFQIIH